MDLITIEEINGHIDSKIAEVKAVAEEAKAAAEQAKVTASGVNKIAPGYSGYDTMTLSAFKTVQKNTETVIFDYSNIMFASCFSGGVYLPSASLEVYGTVDTSLVVLTLQVNDTSHRLNMAQHSTVLRFPIGVKYYKLKLTVKNNSSTSYNIYLRQFSSLATACVSY